MNKVILIGRLTQDLEPKMIKEDLMVCNFSLAVNQGKERTDFINCVALGKTAEVMAQYLKKGNRIAIEGNLKTGSYDNKEGHKVYTTDVQVESFTFL